MSQSQQQQQSGQTHPRKITLVYQKESTDLYISERTNPNSFASLVASVFNLASPSFFLLDQTTKCIFDLEAFFGIESQISNTFSVIPAASGVSPTTTMPISSASASAGHRNLTNSQLHSANPVQGFTSNSSSGAAEFGGKEQSPSLPSGARTPQQQSVVRTTARNSSSEIWSWTNPNYNVGIGIATGASSSRGDYHHTTQVQSQQSQVIHDFEAFMHDAVPHSYYYVVLFFDDQEQMKGYSGSLSRQLKQPYPGVDVFSSLYPSKRSRGPFMPSDSVFLLSVYQGKEMIFERELSLNEPINGDILDALGSYLRTTPKNSSPAGVSYEQQQQQQSHNLHFLSANLVGSSQNGGIVADAFSNSSSANPQINFFNSGLNQQRISLSQQQQQQQQHQLLQLSQQQQQQSQLHHSHASSQVILPYEFRSAEENSNIIGSSQQQQQQQQQQDGVFELMEVLCSSRFRDLFDDEHFKYLLRQAKQRNPTMAAAFSSFKLFNDASELEECLKQIASECPMSLLNHNSENPKGDVSFENNQKRNESDGTGLNTRSSGWGKSKKWNLSDYAGVRRFLRDFNTNNTLTIEEASLIVFSAHPSQSANNPEFTDLLASLTAFSSPEIILQVLKGYANQMGTRIMKKYFLKSEAEIIHKHKTDVFSPICGAFMHLRAMGDIEAFLEILIQNLNCFDSTPGGTHFGPSQGNNNNNAEHRSSYSSGVTSSDVVSAAGAGAVSSTSQPVRRSLLGATASGTVGDLLGQMTSIPETHEANERSGLHKLSCSYSNTIQNEDGAIAALAVADADVTGGDIATIQAEQISGNQVIGENELNDFIGSHRSGGQTSYFAYSQIAKQNTSQRRPSFSIGLNRNDQNGQQERVQRGGIRRGSGVRVFKEQEKSVIEIIHKFHQAQDQVEFDDRYFEALRKLRNTLVLTQEEDTQCDRMYYNRYHSFILILERINADVEFLQNERNRNAVMKMVRESQAEFGQNDEEESPLSKSPEVRNKKHKFLKFKNILNYLLETKNLISVKEANTFSYLYFKDDLSLLSAFEVYTHNQDLGEFVETLQLIDQLNFFKNNLDYDEIEQFDESTKQQLAILFYVKKYISFENEQIFEQLIRMGDCALIDLYNSFRITRKKEEFIAKVTSYAEQRKLELQEAEEKMKEDKSNYSSEKAYMRDTIEVFHSRLLKDVDHIDFFYEMIDNEDERLKGVFELFQYAKDKQEMVQNLTLLYNSYFQRSLEATTLAVLNKNNFSLPQRQRILSKLKNKETSLLVAFHEYLQTKDEEEFKESLSYLVF